MKFDQNNDAGVCSFCWNFDSFEVNSQKFGARGCARFTENLSELTKTWSSGATECRVWIGNCNVKVWKSTEHKLHNIWRSVQFQQNEHTPGATECGVWIGNCNVKVWKSTEHKLHNIWRSVKFQQNEHTPDTINILYYRTFNLALL